MKKNWFLVITALAIFLSCQGPKYDENELPDEYRFAKDVFLHNLNEPVELEVLPDGSIIFVERRGGIKWYDPNRRTMILEDSIPVFFGFEDGLMGMALDPNFAENNWIYLYYSPVGDQPKQHLSRFVWTDRGITDEIVMLVVPTQRDECCHTGGSIEFGPDGLMYLSTGDDTNPFGSDGYAPIDDRPERQPWDARRTSSNTNDLRGKILRIKPEPDGTYSIPEGNLFEDDDPKTRPEIYVMGCRNPYRITVDQNKGWLFWGDVGPDAGESDSIKGPRGHDEMNVAMTAGYYGWPLFVADNKAYGIWDFEQEKSTGYFDPNKPVNKSNNNTGISDLPPARPAMIYYPYAESHEFPMLTSGGRTAMTGPVFYKNEKHDKRHGFPDYFDGRLFVYDWMRDWVFTIKVDSTGTPSNFVPFTPSQDYSNIIDMDFGPDGRLYMIEYGTAWFTQNEDARLSRLNFNRDNRVPRMNVEISKIAGSRPLEVTLDASKSIDYDDDELQFTWKIDEEIFEGPVVNYTFNKNGIHRPRLTLTDGKGHMLIEQFKIEVGNDEPEVKIHIEGNRSFYWPGDEIKYEVDVHDVQDGKLGNGITENEVNFDILYMDGKDKAQLLGHQMPITTGESLVNGSDCYACHKVNDKSVGPSFVEVATRYKNGGDNIKDYLVAKIIKGGSGTWGDHSMSAHPDFTPDEALEIVNFVLSFADIKEKLPLAGQFATDQEELTKHLVFSARYRDKGAPGVSSISSANNLSLRPFEFPAGSVEGSDHVSIGWGSIVNQVAAGGWLSYHIVDLKGISSIDIKWEPHAQVSMSVRLGSLDGQEVANLVGNASDGNDWKRIALDGQNQLTDLYLVFDGDKNAENLVRVERIRFNKSN